MAMALGMLLWVSMLGNELGQMDPDVPSNLCQSLAVETNSSQFSTFSSKSQSMMLNLNILQKFEGTHSLWNCDFWRQTVLLKYSCRNYKGDSNYACPYASIIIRSSRR